MNKIEKASGKSSPSTLAAVLHSLRNNERSASLGRHLPKGTLQQSVRHGSCGPRGDGRVIVIVVALTCLTGGNRTVAVSGTIYDDGKPRRSQSTVAQKRKDRRHACGSSSRLGLRRLLGARPRANTNASSLARSRPPRLIAPAGLLLAEYSPNDAGHSGRRGRVDQTRVLSPRESGKSRPDEITSELAEHEEASSLVKSGFLFGEIVPSRESREFWNPCVLASGSVFLN